jgi:phosphate transport system substrate-binding protein
MFWPRSKDFILAKSQVEMTATNDGVGCLTKVARLCFVSILVVVTTCAESSSDTLLIGVGGTFPLPVYTVWFEHYEMAHPGCRFRYLPSGSGVGVDQVSSGAADFGGTDAPMTDREMAAAKVKVLHFPSVLGAAVPIYNLPGINKTLDFTPQVLSGIFLGTIKKWNHPAILAANPGVALPEVEIIVVHRDRASGTTYILTDYLSKVSPEWRNRVGKGTEVNWPVGRGASGSGGMAETVGRTPYSIGYTELTFALQNHVAYGRVRNAAGKFVKADLQSVTAAGAAGTMPGDFRVSITNAPGKDAYPISSFTWLLIPANLNGTKRPVLTGFLRWMLTTGQSTSVESLGYARVPESVVRQELQAIDHIH